MFRLNLILFSKWLKFPAVYPRHDIKIVYSEYNVLRPFHRCLFLCKTYNSDKKLSNSDNIYKSKIIAKLNLKSDQHAAPFYNLSTKMLLNIRRTTENDKKNGYCENRLYYIASQLKCPPFMLSERLTRRSFIYTLSFEWIESSLKVLLEMGVPPDRIIRDLWVLKYHSKTISERLQRIKDLGIETLYPWMVRCSEDILNRYIEIYQETKTILGNNKSTKVYVAHRLNTTLNIVEEMYSKEPALERIRPGKIKNFLDFLLKEGFSEAEIIIKPRVLSASQRTIKDRLDMLRSLGMKDINLNILCRSRKGFRKYYESLESGFKKKDAIASNHVLN